MDCPMESVIMPDKKKVGGKVICINENGKAIEYKIEKIKLNGNCILKPINQQQISEKTGIAQGDVSKILKAIRELSFVPKRVRAVLDVLGWEVKIIKGGKR